MSVMSLIETGLTLAGIGVAIGLWLYAARQASSREVMLLLGDSLSAFGGRARPERKR